MKKLQKIFIEGKFKFEQLARQGNVALYRKSYTLGKSYTFELITIKSHNGFKMGEVTIPPAEMYPSDKTWGGDVARTFMEKQEDEAFIEYKKLAKRCLNGDL